MVLRLALCMCGFLQGFEALVGFGLRSSMAASHCACS